MPTYDRKRRKWLDYQRETGQGFRMSPEEAEPLRVKLLAYHDAGMSYQAMGDASGMRCSTITSFLFGHGNGNGGIQRHRYETLMAMPFVEPTGKRYGSQGTHDPRLAARRLVALRVAGWPVGVLLTMIECHNRGNFQKLCNGRAKRIGPVPFREIAELYEKLKDVDPLDWGVGLRATRVAKAYVLGLPGPSCWDDDTIDDPEAIPEWTGACGTEEGYRVHVRETIFNNNPLPLCDPCRTAVETRPASQPLKVILNHENLAAAMKASPKPMKALAREVFGDAKAHTDTLYRWRDGTRAPRYAGQVQLLADALDVSPGYLMDEEAMKVEASKPVVGHGMFNPYVVRAALEMDGLSMQKAARLCGVSEASVYQWLRQQAKPSDPKKLKGLADHFGVTVEVFYQ
jgi:hypothetical protein